MKLKEAVWSGRMSLGIPDENAFVGSFVKHKSYRSVKRALNSCSSEHLTLFHMKSLSLI